MLVRIIREGKILGSIWLNDQLQRLCFGNRYISIDQLHNGTYMSAANIVKGPKVRRCRLISNGKEGGLDIESASLLIESKNPKKYLDFSCLVFEEDYQDKDV